LTGMLGAMELVTPVLAAAAEASAPLPNSIGAAALGWVAPPTRGGTLSILGVLHWVRASNGELWALRRGAKTEDNSQPLAPHASTARLGPARTLRQVPPRPLPAPQVTCGLTQLSMTAGLDALRPPWVWFVCVRARVQKKCPLLQPVRVGSIYITFKIVQ
jgi:hypothetical protein